jgi:predicted RNase H-like nuclease (RuvC/YqgF family)
VSNSNDKNKNQQLMMKRNDAPTTPSTPSTPTTTTTVTIPRDKYEELIKEFQKLQSQNNLLKKAVIDEQKKNKALQSELERKSSQLEARTEENDVLGFNNLRLEKRCAQLMFDLEEKSKSSSTRNDSFFSSIWGGSSTGNIQSAEYTQLQRDLEVTQEDLKSKIVENENVHIQMYELMHAHDSTVAKLKDNITDLQSNIHHKDKKIEDLTAKLESMIKQQKQEKDKISEQIQKLKSEIKLKKESEKDMNDSARKMHDELASLREFVDRKVCVLVDHVEFV